MSSTRPTTPIPKISRRPSKDRNYWLLLRSLNRRKGKLTDGNGEIGSRRLQWTDLTQATAPYSGAMADAEVIRMVKIKTGTVKRLHKVRRRVKWTSSTAQ